MNRLRFLGSQEFSIPVSTFWLMFGLLYVMDALRADYLSCYGADDPTSPALSSLCDDAVRFEYAYAPSTWTKPSAAAMMTGNLPRTIDVMHQSDRVPETDRTLAKQLSSEGVNTLGISANAFFSPYFGFSGFDDFDLLLQDDELLNKRRKSKEPSGATQDRIEMMGVDKPIVPLSIDIHERIENRLHTLEKGEDLFATAWSVDTHGPYFVRGNQSWFGNDLDSFIYEKDATERDPKTIQSIYRDMIRYNDLQLGNLIEHLRSIGLYEDSLIIVVGDHGEALGDETDALGRSIVGHGGKPTESKIRVPLIVKYPENRGAGTVVDEIVSIIDIYSTVLSEFGGSIPSSVESEVLTQNGPTDSNRSLLIESQPTPDSFYWGAVRTGNSKYTILKKPSIKQPKKLAKYGVERILRGSQRVERIGTSVDDNPLGVKQGQEQYLELVDRCTDLHNKLFSDFEQSNSDSVDEEVKDQLRKLGYFN